MASACLFGPAPTAVRGPELGTPGLVRRAALLLAAATALVGGPALASTPQAWSAYDRQVRSACVAASALAAVRIQGQRVDLPNLGLSALLLEGTYPQPHMRGQKGLELCLVEQRSGRASVVEADRLIGPPDPALTPAIPAPAGSAPR